MLFSLGIHISVIVLILIKASSGVTVFFPFFNFSIILFLAAGLFLIIPTRSLIKKARSYMHISYEKGKEANVEIQRAVENMFLIKLLKKEEGELSKFSKTILSFNESMLQNHRYSLFTGYLPSFLTLVILSIILIFFLI